MERSAASYWRFAHDDPTLNDLMFHERVELQFVPSKTPAALHAAFDALTELVIAAGRAVSVELADPETATGWATMHGVVSPALSSRVRRSPDHTGRLVDLAADIFTAGMRAGHFDQPTPAKG